MKKNETINYKFCTICSTLLKKSDFHKGNNSCKKCANKKRKEYYLLHKDKEKKRAKQYYLANRVYLMIKMKEYSFRIRKQMKQKRKIEASKIIRYCLYCGKLIPQKRLLQKITTKFCSNTCTMRYGTKKLRLNPQYNNKIKIKARLRYKNDEKYRKKKLAGVKKWRENNPDYMKNYMREYRKNKKTLD